VADWLAQLGNTDHTFDGSEIRLTTFWMYKNPVNNEINYQPQLVNRISSINSIID